MNVEDQQLSTPDERKAEVRDEASTDSPGPDINYTAIFSYLGA
jgi:hypothetical protein